MKRIRIKHSMDKEYRNMTLDEAFLEALGMSEGQSCEQELFESNLLKLIEENKDFLNAIKDEYKENILRGWEYTFDYNDWMASVKEVTSSNTDFPKQVTVGFVKRLVNDIHSREEDLYDGDLIDRIEEYICSNFMLFKVNIDDISYDDYYIDDDNVSEYKDMPIDTMPPIILEKPYFKGDKYVFPIIDGCHRCKALKDLGVSEIEAYIPVEL